MGRRGIQLTSIRKKSKGKKKKKSGERRRSKEHLPSWRGGGGPEEEVATRARAAEESKRSGRLSLGGRSDAELRAPTGRVPQAQGIGAEAVPGARVWGPEPEQRWDAPGIRGGAEAPRPAAETEPGRGATREPRVRRGRAGDCSAARRSLSNVHQRRR